MKKLNSIKTGIAIVIVTFVFANSLLAQSWLIGGNFNSGFNPR